MNEQAEKFIENVLKNNIVETIITIAISILLYSIIKKLHIEIERSHNKWNKRKKIKWVQCL